MVVSRVLLGATAALFARLVPVWLGAPVLACVPFVAWLAAFLRRFAGGAGVGAGLGTEVGALWIPALGGLSLVWGPEVPHGACPGPAAFELFLAPTPVGWVPSVATEPRDDGSKAFPFNEAGAISKSISTSSA
jgi:hypothetical protein